ncbi:MAG TPA: hypothetical protein VLZ06_01600 [Solirubrobacteraceae bacterium]|nr:hypothetical protein [Solirubrobacteraceae bacterium]
MAQLVQQHPVLGGPFEASSERAARAALKAQISRLEHELSGIVAGRFPYIPAPRAARPGSAPRAPRLPDLGELERERDHLAGRLQELRRAAAARTEHERRARVQLERMRLEPGRYKFVRLPVRDLGQGGCGVWQVRPRLGLIGMLAGWWQLKLSSGCPLARGSRSTRGPALPTRAAPPGAGSDAP